MYYQKDAEHKNYGFTSEEEVLKAVLDPSRNRIHQDHLSRYPRPADGLFLFRAPSSKPSPRGRALDGSSVEASGSRKAT